MSRLRRLNRIVTRPLWESRPWCLSPKPLLCAFVFVFDDTPLRHSVYGKVLVWCLSAETQRGTAETEEKLITVAAGPCLRVASLIVPFSLPVRQRVHRLPELSRGTFFFFWCRPTRPVLSTVATPASVHLRYKYPLERYASGAPGARFRPTTPSRLPKRKSSPPPFPFCDRQKATPGLFAAAFCLILPLTSLLSRSLVSFLTFTTSSLSLSAGRHHPSPFPTLRYLYPYYNTSSSSWGLPRPTPRPEVSRSPLNSPTTTTTPPPTTTRPRRSKVSNYFATVILCTFLHPLPHTLHCKHALP